MTRAPLMLLAALGAAGGVDTAGAQADDAAAPRVAATLQTADAPRALVVWPDGAAHWVGPGEQRRGCRLEPDGRGVICGDRVQRLDADRAARPPRGGEPASRPRETQVPLRRPEWRRLTADPQRLVQTLSLRPVIADGLTEAWEVESIAAPLDGAGALRAGDRLVALDGVPVRDAVALMAATRRLAAADGFYVDLQRGGEALRLHVVLTD